MKNSVKNYPPSCEDFGIDNAKVEKNNPPQKEAKTVEKTRLRADNPPSCDGFNK